MLRIFLSIFSISKFRVAGRAAILGSRGVGQRDKDNASYYQ